MTNTFEELGLSKDILDAVESMGFTTPTPIQEKTIPIALAHKDVVGAAQTGTGKTAAFVLPIMDILQQQEKEFRDKWFEKQREIEAEKSKQQEATSDKETADNSEVSAGYSAEENPEDSTRRREAQKDESENFSVDDKNHHDSKEHSEGKQGRKKNKKKKHKKNPPVRKGPFALIVTPTRELAQQIDEVSTKVGAFTHQRVLTVVGGKKYGPQIEGIKKGIDLLVATPGRLIDLMDQNAVDLSQVEFLVLDEADRMLDMGFWPSVRKIVAATPEKRQTLLFSATMSKDVLNQAKTLLNEPEYVEIAHKNLTADTVEQYIMPVSQTQKADLLQALLEEKGGTRILVFTRTKRRADACAKRLKKASFRADSIHSDKSQSQRTRILNDFKKGKIDILIATDVLARGIDISEVNYVVNYDVPLDPEDYVHRIGRTGRAGEQGVAYTFVGVDEISALREVEYFTKRIIDVYDIEGFEYSENRVIPRADRSAERGKTSTGKRKYAYSGSRKRRSYPRGGRRR